MVYRDPSRSVEAGVVEAMLAPIRYRGPDGSGVHLDGPAGIGHVRLSIIDLGSGAQPMTNEDGTVWIVFNGEIYNFQGLRQRLEARGHVFRSNSDTEVILHLYEEMGADCVRELQGMFAFAIWDGRKRRLFAARDRVGIKPFYYARTSDGFVFASEIKSLLTQPAVDRAADAEAVRTFLAFNYVPGEATLFSSVRKLLPGHSLMVEAGEVRIERYWDLHFEAGAYAGTFEEARDELLDLIGTSVRDHMIADVPVGVLLSGGVDSSAVLGLAVEAAGRRVQTFTVGFDGGGVVDERPYARLIADRLGTEHHETTLSPGDFWEFLPRYVRHMEEPVCEPPAVALHHVTALARRHGVKVLLSGEGGDEAFAGYPNYPNMLRLRRLEDRLGPLARLVGAGGTAIGAALGRERLVRYGMAIGRPLEDHYFSRTSGPSGLWVRHAREWFTPGFLRASAGCNPSDRVRALLESVPGQPLLNQMLYVDTMSWLPDDLLVKADKMTMASSVELRVPLLDHRVLEFAARLPVDFKVSGHETKRLLKAAFAQVVPAEILNRRKAGFPVPYAEWLRRDFRDGVRDVLLSERARARGYFQPGVVERLLHRHEQTGSLAKEVFSLLVLELWHREFTDESGRGAAAAGRERSAVPLNPNPVDSLA